MTGKRLIELIEEYGPEREIVISKLAAGKSSLSALSYAWACSYAADANSSIAGIEKMTDEMRNSGYSDKDMIVGGIPALVLYPEH